MFEGFDRKRIETTGASINLAVGGDGPPLLLLHGFPQTHAMWHKIAPALAQQFTVVASDLRGYGDSSKPPSGPDQIAYSKREMARDQVEAMAALGHERFHLAGHDQGGRVAHRLAVDWPDRAIRLAVLDIAPTREMYRATDEAFARAYWHWFFLIRPHPVPETMIGADPEAFWRAICGSGSAGLRPFTMEAIAAYLRCFRDPETIRANCDDYRAAAGIDLVHDDEDGNKKVSCPLLCLWGRDGVIEQCFDPLQEWRKRANDVSGRALPGGHFLAEEVPEEVTTALLAFFREA